jgi:hypothetical protein
MDAHLTSEIAPRFSKLKEITYERAMWPETAALYSILGIIVLLISCLPVL